MAWQKPRQRPVSPPGPARPVSRWSESAPAQRTPSGGSGPKHGRHARLEQGFEFFDVGEDDEAWLTELEQRALELERELFDWEAPRARDASGRADGLKPRRGLEPRRPFYLRRETASPLIHRSPVPPPGPARPQSQWSASAPAQRTLSRGRKPGRRADLGQAAAGFEFFGTEEDEAWLTELEQRALELERELFDWEAPRARDASGRADGLKSRDIVQKIRDMNREHPPGWLAWLATLLIPMLMPLPITGQSPPQPVQQNVIQRSGDPLVPDPELLRALVGKLSLQQRAELASGKLSLSEVELAMKGLSHSERLRLAMEGFSDEQLSEFMRLFADINGMLPKSF